MLAGIFATLVGVGVPLGTNDKLNDNKWPKYKVEQKIIAGKKQELLLQKNANSLLEASDTLLEGMFGQTAGISETLLSSKTDLNSNIIQNKQITNEKIDQKKIVKIVDFEKENKNKTKIKIKTF